MTNPLKGNDYQLAPNYHKTGDVPAQIWSHMAYDTTLGLGHQNLKPRSIYSHTGTHPLHKP